MKFECVITVWDNGVFALRDKTEGDEENIEYEFEKLFNKMRDKLREKEERFKKIMEDDDIPF